MALAVQVELASVNSGPLNPALMDFSFADLGVSGLTLPELCARVALYTARAITVMSEDGITMSAIRTRTLPSDPFVPVAFPQTEYAAGKADATFDTSIVAAIVYATTNITPTAQISSGRGDSVCVTTKALTGGRKGIGRHFIPFLARESVSGAGLIGGAQATAVNDAYAECFLGTGTGVLADAAFPGVYSRLDSTLRQIELVATSIIPSRLKSRTK